MLSVDWLNPASLVAEVFNFSREYIAVASTFAFFSILYANAGELSYYVCKMFFQNILNIFFSSIEVLGRENIPQHGPVIFSGNHMNQFVDGAVALVTCPHKLNFLVAASSFKMMIVGHFARLMNAVPVHRPIDNASRATGKINFIGMKLLGKGTTFKKIDLRDRIRPVKSKNEYKIIEVISDEEAVLGMDKGDADPMDEIICQGKDKFVEFDILAWVDQASVFSNVHTAIHKGESVIIFPEGGSHDNTDLLPLKGGVAAIAYGALSDHVCIVPVGLNYFRGHRFRGRVVVEYGTPIYITKEMAHTFQTSKREAYTTLLSQLATGMRSVLVTADSYDDLKLIHTARRLYQRSSTRITTQRRQDLARRFSMAHRILKERYSEDVPKDLEELQHELERYQNTLSEWGIYDYQVNNLDIPFRKLLYMFVHGFFIFFAASIPSIVLNAPVGIAAKFWAQSKQKTALAKSKVKIAATDVLLSNKIVFSLGAVPTLWFTYFLLMYFFSGWETKTIAVLFLSCPLLSYAGIRSVEAGMADLKDLRPAFLRLMPSFREQAKIIPRQREIVQKHVRAAVKKYGPSLGPLYYETNPQEWEQELRSLIRNSGENLFKKLEEDVGESDDDDDDDDDDADNQRNVTIDKVVDKKIGKKTNASVSPRERKEGTRVPTGIKRFKDD
jgi:glycerol-3-phosphate O-acyltransferase / dihydroxyacetone phosphate acyltransferase